MFTRKACWGTLPSTVIDIGQRTAGNTIYFMKSIEDCKAKCEELVDYEAGCNSFTYCPNSKECSLYATKLNKYSPVYRREDDCASSYNRCLRGGNCKININTFKKFL